MADERRTKVREATHLPNLKISVRADVPALPDAPLSPEQAFLQRQAEVSRQDQEDFGAYVQEKTARDQEQKAAQADAAANKRPAVNRRRLLKWAAGTAAAGEAMARGYQMLAGEDIPAHGVMHSGVAAEG
jgi:hypothetical protein